MNNVLAVLSVLLKKAVEWEVIERMPCTVKLLRGRQRHGEPSTISTSTNDSSRSARSIDPRTLLVVLLGGDAGMRCGEIMALEWNDVDLVKRQLCVRQSDWNGQVGTPTGSDPRVGTCQPDRSWKLCLHRFGREW